MRYVAGAALQVTDCSSRHISPVLCATMYPLDPAQAHTRTDGGFEPEHPPHFAGTVSGRDAIRWLVDNWPETAAALESREVVMKRSSTRPPGR